MAEKILFVCTGNMDRSPTAEYLLRSKEGFEVKSAGTWIHARKRVSKALIEWADLIFVMEEHHKNVILSICPEAEGKVIVLDIPDIYRRNDPELVEILKEKLAKYFENRMVNDCICNRGRCTPTTKCILSEKDFFRMFLDI